ncbi:MAG: SPOR domain-containing protein [Candidatus Omnitrophica bacterium]|nr:SPOR domain-containing protein [Candidatus Omnitrophota bacterium]
MTQREPASQLELFSVEGEPRHPVAARAPEKPFAEYVRKYERVVLFAIGFFIVAVAAFCLGVEKGKRLAAGRGQERLDVAAAPSLPASRAPSAAVRPIKLNADGSYTIRGRIKDIPVRQEIILTPLKQGREPQQRAEGSYTIQVASYKNRQGAELEIARLRKSGLTPMVRKSGSYTIVCVGQFTNQDKARSLLTQLKSKYRDCYIRRL